MAFIAAVFLVSGVGDDQKKNNQIMTWTTFEQMCVFT